ncbi:MAG: DUF3306 domain-containing protein [Rubrivivax sp.]|nr:DUF3306 domain-containing protein [Rubrivivax sp.]
MNEQDDNFLSRWSRRKALVRQGVEPPPAAVPPVPVPVAAPVVVAAQPPLAAAGTLQGSGAAADDTTEPGAPAVATPPKLTLDDVEALTPESDFSRFIARDVDAKVKNSAMRKLFADPHYNVMDGLDIYISDYNTPDPLPKSMLRQLVQARMLGLLDDDLPEQPAADELAQAAPAPVGVVAEVEVEVAEEQGGEAANDEPVRTAANDATQDALPALPAADTDPPIIVLPDVPAVVPSADAAVASDRGAAQPAPGSSSRAS